VSLHGLLVAVLGFAAPALASPLPEPASIRSADEEPGDAGENASAGEKASAEEPDGTEGAEGADEVGGTDVDLFPEATVHLMAARYAPSETDLRWTTWIGAGVAPIRFDETVFFATADIETTLGNERRAFDATQTNYHLQLGVRRHFRRLVGELYFDHVSRHVVDREKTRAVDWNALGARAGLDLGDAFLGVPTRVSLGIGHTTLESVVGYQLEVTGGIESDLYEWPGGTVYARARMRAVTVKEDADLDRGSFLDGSTEAGMRISRNSHFIEMFVSFEHRNDVLLLEASLRNRALFGIRIGGGPPPLLASHVGGLGPRLAGASPAH
jgi:hypothetical protein